ncbi:MAG TPA: ABC transporter substrate binding protein [Deltaproteobacteria bacterium]|jgi:ABC-type uncharacterized transport system substrate-binding protein|nr:ABC transporter substrate binding protein [Deltaproteobacteria bacterium]HOI07581.1 ABC transporter substrate binding protein [Deltaproteobacteria bacterium]
MRKAVSLVVLCLVVLLSAPCPAREKTYRVEVLQVTGLEELQEIYDGFLRELEDNGLVQGRNLQVNRTIIDFDMENGSWSRKLKVYWAIRDQASRIAREKPDLVLTMGMPVTQHARDKITAAGIPLVFTALAYPAKVGCRSLTEAGPGFTGSTTWMDMKEALRIVRTALPGVKTFGMVHSEYSGSSNHVEDVLREGPAAGLTFLTKTVRMKDRITPALKELQASGIQAVMVPSDPYYGLRDYEAARELMEFSKKTRMPVVSLVRDRFLGSILDVCVEFRTTGALAGSQAVRILKEGAKPESLPVVRQQGLTVMANAKNALSLGIVLPPAFLQTARPADAEPRHGDPAAKGAPKDGRG